LGTGRENAKSYLRANPKLMAVIRKQIMEEVKKAREAELSGNESDDSSNASGYETEPAE
jgi:hypothetical protein